MYLCIHVSHHSNMAAVMPYELKWQILKVKTVLYLQKVIVTITIFDSVM